MVKYESDELGRTFQALADPTRRAILARLETEPALSVSALAEPFPMQLNAVMKHLDVLSDAGLVARHKSGRTVSVTLTPQPMEAAMAWLQRYERFWTASLDRLAAFVETPPEA
ncbi:MAG: helix-turn-helix transcriptional regulator [Caulobacterales bacterium]|nr:helix-turn-helix transcriptional regulator [Caulobacterales bacterium]